MSLKAMAWAWDMEIPSSMKFTLLALSDFHNEETGQCNPSIETLTRKTSQGRNTVCSNLKKLDSAGLITVKKQFNKSSQYQLNLAHKPVSIHQNNPAAINIESANSTKSRTSTKSHTHSSTKSHTHSSTKSRTENPNRTPIEPKNGEKKRKRFVPPTESQVQEYAFWYCNKKNKPMPEYFAEEFCGYWESCGWERKSGKMKDWEATARTSLINQWKREGNNHENHQRNNGQHRLAGLHQRTANNDF